MKKFRDFLQEDVGRKKELDLVKSVTGTLALKHSGGGVRTNIPIIKDKKGNFIRVSELKNYIIRNLDQFVTKTGQKMKVILKVDDKKFLQVLDKVVELKIEEDGDILTVTPLHA